MRRKTHRIIELIYDILGTGGTSLYGDVDTKYAHQGAISSVNTNYMILHDIFKNVSVNKDDVFVDIGCGKGRLFAYLRLRRLCKRMI